MLNLNENVFFRPKFRSYVPEDETLKENVIPSAKPGDVESEVKDQLNAANSRVVIEDLVSKTSFMYNNITVCNLYLYIYKSQTPPTD